MINQLPEISVPDWLAEISQSTITIDPFPLNKVLEDSLYYPSSGFDGDPVILHFFYKILCILKFGRKKIWKIKKINFYIIVIVPPIATWLPQL
mgnify:CR=1 FL=1